MELALIPLPNPTGNMKRFGQIQMHKYFEMNNV